MEKDNSSLTTRNTDIVISSFSLQKSGVVPIGNPTFEQWETVLDFVQKSEQAVHFWIGDLLNYGENNWGEMYTQAIDVTNFDYGTLANDKSVSKSVPIENRKSDLSFEHHKIVAKLEPEEQEKWLEKAVEEHMTVRDLRREMSGRSVKEEEQKQSLIELEIAAKNYCDKNGMSREDMAILLMTDDGEMVVDNGHLKKIDEKIMTKLKFLFGE